MSTISLMLTACRLAGSATRELPGTESLTGQLSAIIMIAVVFLDGDGVEGMISNCLQCYCSSS